MWENLKGSQWEKRAHKTRDYCPGIIRIIHGAEKMKIFFFSRLHISVIFLSLLRNWFSCNWVGLCFRCLSSTWCVTRPTVGVTARCWWATQRSTESALALPVSTWWWQSSSSTSSPVTTSERSYTTGRSHLDLTPAAGFPLFCFHQEKKCY